MQQHLAVQKILKEDSVIEKTQCTAKVLNDKLNEEFINHKNVGEIRSIGLINAIELVEDKKNKIGFDSNLRMGYQIYKKAIEYGLILRPLGNVLYFILIINEEEALEAVYRCKTNVFDILGK